MLKTRRIAVAVISLVAVLALAAGLAGPAPAKASATSPVVVIDAGHQYRADLRLEPIGPGATTYKPRVAGGTRGIVTGRPESLVNLQVSLKLAQALRARGVTVIMIRTSQYVNIANSRRALIANAAHADLLIRVHCDGSTNHSIRGFLMVRPARNIWTGPLVVPSSRAASAILASTLAATGARNRGIQARSDMSGFNWSKVPVVIAEMGVMTNSADDRLLSSAAYQQKLANGMAAGIMTFLGR